MINVQSQWQKLDWLSTATPFGVWSQFGRTAGNISFALLPAKEDPAALHVFILHCHHAAHLAAPDQSRAWTSLCSKTPMTRWSPLHIKLLEIYTIICVKPWYQVHKRPKCNPVLNAQQQCPVALNLFRLIKKKKYTDVYVYILYHLKIPCNVWGAGRGTIE